jgi:hypothetical protein
MLGLIKDEDVLKLLFCFRVAFGILFFILIYRFCSSVVRQIRHEYTETEQNPEQNEKLRLLLNEVIEIGRTNGLCDLDVISIPNRGQQRTICLFFPLPAFNLADRYRGQIQRLKSDLTNDRDVYSDTNMRLVQRAICKTGQCLIKTYSATMHDLDWLRNNRDLVVRTFIKIMKNWFILYDVLPDIHIIQAAFSDYISIRSEAQACLHRLRSEICRISSVRERLAGNDPLDSYRNTREINTFIEETNRDGRWGRARSAIAGNAIFSTGLGTIERVFDIVPHMSGWGVSLLTFAIGLLLEVGNCYSEEQRVRHVTTTVEELLSRHGGTVEDLLLNVEMAIILSKVAGQLASDYMTQPNEFLSDVREMFDALYTPFYRPYLAQRRLECRREDQLVLIPPRTY